MIRAIASSPSSTGSMLCPRHHTAVHEGGFRISGDANATLTFHRPDGTVLGTSHAGPVAIAA